MQMLDRCKELLSGKHPCGIDYNTLMTELASEWLQKHDPVERNKRRKRALKKAVKEFKSHPTAKNLRQAYSQLDKAAKKNIYHQNKFNRIKSHLTQQLKEKKPQIKKKSTQKKNKKKKK